MKSLRWQLLISHLLLGVILLAVMIVAMASFFHLGHSIDRILKNNYDSVIAAENMKETLERQDSAATFYLAGQVQKARRQYGENRPLFEKWSDVEAHNITEVGEQQLSDGLVDGYPVYRRDVERLLYANPPMPRDQARAYYFGTLEPSFLRLKSLAQGVLDVNQDAMIRADTRTVSEARLSSWVLLTAMLVAVFVAVLLANLTVRSVMTPLAKFARQAEDIGAGRLENRVDVDSPAEIAALAVGFNQMADRLQEARRIEEQRLHRAERMSDAALESLYDPVIVTDASRSIVRINRAAEDLFGMPDGVEGKPLASVVDEPDVSRAIEEVVTSGARFAIDTDTSLIRWRIDGVERFYRLRASPMRDDDDTLLGAVAVLEDVTHLRELDRLKSEFISVASHELRTPVTSLRLAVDLLREGTAGRLTAKQRTLVDAQNEDLQRLQRLMQDLLDVTRFEASAAVPKLETVDVQALLEPAVRNIAPLAGKKGVDIALYLDGANPPTISVDRGQMSRAVANLLDNALRHTERGGRIEVSARKRDGTVQISVKDTGSGIPADYLPRIFERFVQVPGATRGGSGLGLSIVRAIAQAHGGDVDATSELGKGSVFTITLPIPSA